MREGGVDAVHVTVCYHEDFRETVEAIVDWNRRFERHADLIFLGRTAADIERARATGRTAIFFGLQNSSAIEDDIGLVEILHTLGVRFMQLTYNNQSLLGSGCYEAEDTGITRMGREVIARDEPRRHGDRHVAFGRALHARGDRSVRPADRDHACQPVVLAQGPAQQVGRGAEGARRLAAACSASRSTRII